MRLKSRRLFAVMAMVAAMLVPAAVASAGGGGGIDTHECAEDHYDSTNPQHYLYGRTQGTPVVDGKMQVDLSAWGTGAVVFWDQHFSTGSDGVVIVGTNFADVICGTTGSDEIRGLQGNDRIFGNGSGDGVEPNYDPLIPGSGDRLFGSKGHDFVTPGDGTGLDDMVDDSAALIGGGRGDDLLYAGPGWRGTLVRGGEGDDEIFGDDACCPDDQVLRGGDGDDVIHAGRGARTQVFGGAGNDILNAGDADRQDISGNKGDDILTAARGDYQNLYGGEGDDVLVAGPYNSQGLFGGLGNDTISGLGGGGHNHVADGGPGDDTITGDPGAVYGFHAFGGAGDDSVFGGPEADDLFGDYASAPGQVVGIVLRDFAPAYFIDAAATGADHLEGGLNEDDVYGGPGDDTLYGNTPKTTNPNIGLDLSDGVRDDLFGDDGDDTLFANGFAAGCADSDFADGGANFAAGDSSWGLAVGDTLNVENHSDTAAGCV